MRDMQGQSDFLFNLKSNDCQIAYRHHNLFAILCWLYKGHPVC